MSKRVVEGATPIWLCNTIHIGLKDELLTNKVAALKAEREKLLADTQLKVNHFDKQINQLLAIEMSPEAS